MLIKTIALKKKKDIILLDNVKETDEDLFEITRTVLNLGNECPQNGVKEGDKIFISSYSGSNIIKHDKISEKEIHTYSLINYDEILGTHE